MSWVSRVNIVSGVSRVRRVVQVNGELSELSE